MSTDLFGNTYDEPTFEQEYQEYISSAKWKLKRERALYRADYKCQKCGFSKWSVKLEVHHLTYERFRNEKPEDLIVVCEDCHRKEDEQRKRKVLLEQMRKRWDARLDGWASKVFGDEWYDFYDADDIEERFEQWLENQW